MAVTQDKTDVIKFSAAADAVTGRMYIKKMVWDNPTTVGNAISITDTAGTIVWSSTCAVAKETLTQDFVPPLRVDGLIVATMTTGTFFAYLD